MTTLAITIAVAAVVTVWWRWDSRPIELDELRARYALPASRFVPLAGVDTHIVDEGPRAGPVLILLHGNANSLLIWNDWARAFVAAGYRVIRFDMPPYGLSGLAPDGRHGVAATHAALIELMDREDVSRAVLIGTANGGPPAAWLAFTHPDRVAGLVFVNTPFYPPTHNTDTLNGQRLARAYVFPYFGRPWFADWLYVRELAGRGQAIDTRLASHVHDILRRADVPDALALYGSSYSFAEPRWNPDKLSNRDMLARIAAPTLIMWGSLSLLPDSEAARLADTMHNAQPRVRVYPEGGHWLPIYRPSETAADVLSFLADVPGFATQQATP
ncbi:MAG: alpha/beta fold hydrolase [Rhodospirillaceae bacterium]|nr:alpha/beta fold hydrolase [Rhodospirillaceae bacterium]